LAAPNTIRRDWISPVLDFSDTGFLRAKRDNILFHPQISSILPFFFVLSIGFHAHRATFAEPVTSVRDSSTPVSEITDAL